jgi:hypothetical protein
MSEESVPNSHAVTTSAVQKEETQKQHATGWGWLFPSRKSIDESSQVDSVEELKDSPRIQKWSLGILNDKKTEEVPGQFRL